MNALLPWSAHQRPAVVESNLSCSRMSGLCPPSSKIVPPRARSRDLLLAASLDRVFSVSHLFKSTVKKSTESEKGGFERGENPAFEHIPYIATGEKWRSLLSIMT